MALRKISLSLAAVAALASVAFADVNSVEAEKVPAVPAAGGTSLEAAFKNGKVDGQVRALYIAQLFNQSTNNQTPNVNPNTNNSGFALGGNLGYTTGSYYGVSAGAKFYTSQVLGHSAYLGGSNNPATNQGALAGYFYNGATPGQSYSTLGQAFVQGTYGKTIVKIGRQEINSPLAGADDGYMIPNLFQAGVVINQDIPDTTLVAGYINGMQGGTTGDSHANMLSNVNGQTGFVSMSRSALGGAVDMSVGNMGGGTIANQPVWAFAVVNSSVPNTTLQAWYYNNTNVLQAYYLGADSGLEIAKDWKIGAGVQYYQLIAQGSTKTFLQNAGLTYPSTLNNGTQVGINNLNYGVTGAKLNLSNPLGLTPEVAATFIGGVNNGAYVFGAWGGYPNYTDMAMVSTGNFAGYVGGLGGGYANAQGSNQWKFSLTQDLGKVGLKDAALAAAYGRYDFATSNNNGLNFDASVWDIVYTCKATFVKNMEAKIYWENVSYSTPTNYSNVKSTNYVYLKGIYSF